ncbi:long-chain fatty acid--CoA ligase [bacterium]|nr:long-chain fatty acid--CoA ligase [bacterium]
MSNPVTNPMETHYVPTPLIEWAQRNPTSTLPKLFRQAFERHNAANRNYLGCKINGVYRFETYQQIRDKVENFASALIELGFQSKDRVGQISNNRPEWVITDMGTMHAGGIHAPLYPTLAGEAIEYILRDSGARIAVCATPRHLEAVLACEKELPTLEHIVCMFDPGSAESSRKLWSWDAFLQLGADNLSRHKAEIEKRVEATVSTDVCGLVYTSGTTGEPKGAMLMHGNFCSNALTAVPLLEFKTDDLELSFLPLCHVFERVAYYCVTSVGASIAYAESVDTVGANMKEVRPTVMPSVPRLFEKIYARITDKVKSGSLPKRKLFAWAMSVGQKHQQAKMAGKLNPVLKLEYAMAHKLVLSKLHQETGGRIRLFCSGGAPLRKDVGEFFLSAGFVLTEGYGLTETSPVITFNPLHRPKNGTVGKVIPDVKVKIAEDGEILCQGPNVMLGYFGKAQATRDAIDDDGWFHTGDIGMMDDEGYLAITDRKKDLLVMSNGKNVAPQPIEQLVQSSPLIEQCVVLGDNKKFISALIVPTYANLKDWCAQNGVAHDPRALAEDPKLKEYLQSEVNRICADLSAYEKVKAIALLPAELTLENGEMTPTLKVKRKVVNQKYAAKIASLYPED